MYIYYNQGFYCYGVKRPNPHDKGTAAYNEFERGWNDAANEWANNEN